MIGNKLSLVIGEGLHKMKDVTEGFQLRLQDPFLPRIGLGNEVTLVLAFWF